MHGLDDKRLGRVVQNNDAIRLAILVYANDDVALIARQPSESLWADGVLGGFDHGDGENIPGAVVQPSGSHPVDDVTARVIG